MINRILQKNVFCFVSIFSFVFHVNESQFFLKLLFYKYNNTVQMKYKFELFLQMNF